MSKVPIQTQIIYDKHSEFQGLEIFLEGNRKLIVDNLDNFEPLTKYIDADKLIEIASMMDILEQGSEDWASTSTKTGRTLDAL